MVLEEFQNNYKFDIYLEDEIIYIRSKPDLYDTIVQFKYVNGRFTDHQQRILVGDVGTWFRVDNDGVFILNILKDDVIIFHKVIILELELPLIKKEDITIIVDDCLDIKLLDSHKKFGNLIYGNVDNINDYNTKYVIYIKNYLINIVYLINKMFFNSCNLCDRNEEIFMFDKSDKSQPKIIDGLRIENINI